MTGIEQEVAAFIEENLEDPSLFLVSVKMTGTSNKMGKLKVLLDGDQGINIDVCAQMSRKLGQWIEEEEKIDNAFHLEVSSPGIDFPLESIRQYKKNIGRTLAVVQTDGKKVVGELLEVNEETFTVLPELKGKKKKTEEPNPKQIAYDTVKSSIIVIKF